MNKQMELKATKMLMKIYRSMFFQIRQRAMNCVEYRKDKPEDVYEQMAHIANPAKWDYSGLITKEDKAVLETLEYLLDDNQEEIYKYKEWNPIIK